MFWYITPCVRGLLFRRTTEGEGTSPEKHSTLNQDPILGFLMEVESQELLGQITLGHWKPRTVTSSLSKESDQKFTSKRHRGGKASPARAVPTFAVYFTSHRNKLAHFIPVTGQAEKQRAKSKREAHNSRSLYSELDEGRVLRVGIEADILRESREQAERGRGGRRGWERRCTNEGPEVK